MKKYILLNTLFSVLLQIVNIIANLVLPKAILSNYGSDVNGLVQSITQFLSIISFAEFGIGAVVQSSLYKPLAQNDVLKINRILTSGQKFYRRIAIVLSVYVVTLVFTYPFLVNDRFNWLFTVILIVSISISYFAQYYFGLIRGILLNADLKGYVQYGVQILTLLLNTAVSIALIKFGQSIQIVKFVSSLIFLIRPIILKIYVDKKYSLNFREPYELEPIEQKWNGVAQHISAVVLEQTDTIVLTLFSTLANVSIYSVYHMVAFGIRAFFNSITVGFQSAFGHLWAIHDESTIEKAFLCLELGCHLVTVFLYSCTGVLIVPFVAVYTKNVNDANYINVSFAALLVFARAAQCLRTPYNIMILASGHYKQTQMCHVVAAIINIVVSVCLVVACGLIGVAIGTLIALLFQTIWMAFYDYRHLVKRRLRYFVKQICVDIIIAGTIIVSTIWIRLESFSYFSWLLMALKVVPISLAITVGFSFVFYRYQSRLIVRYMLKKRIS